MSLPAFGEYYSFISRVFRVRLKSSPEGGVEAPLQFLVLSDGPSLFLFRFSGNSLWVSSASKVSSGSLGFGFNDPDNVAGPNRIVDAPVLNVSTWSLHLKRIEAKSGLCCRISSGTDGLPSKAGFLVAPNES
jgi:hypothetical protein